MSQRNSHFGPSAAVAAKPRKLPLQARSRATIDAIYEATLQVLVVTAPERLTTSRVAARAGVSVGTVYQYFPNKQALYYGLNARYLDDLAARMEHTCAALNASPSETMIDGLIDSYWFAKLTDPERTRALYRSAARLEREDIVDRFAERMRRTVRAMLASASDFAVTDLDAAVRVLTTALFGAARQAAERPIDPAEADVLRYHLSTMCRAYVRAIGAVVPA